MQSERCFRGRRYGNRSAGTGVPRSERGAVLIVVLVLSAVVLAITATLIYLVTAGTQTSGLQKRYKSALEAGLGGAEAFYQVIALRGETSGMTTYTNALVASGITVSFPTPAACTGTSGATAYLGLQARLMTYSNTWTNCDSSISINPANPATYDMRMTMGTTDRYDVYAKIVATIPGNTGGDAGLWNKGVSNANSGEVAVMPISYYYAVEAVAENTARNDERAKLSILYQY